MNNIPRIAITGTGAITPAGLTTSDYISALRERRSMISHVSGTGKSLSQTQIAGSINAKEGLRSSRLHFLADHALQQALTQAELQMKNGRVGLVFATAISTTLEMEAAFVKGENPPPQQIRFGDFTEQIANRYGLKGPALTISTGCTAGIDAFGLAREQIILGRCDSCLVVAADATLSPIVFAAFDQIGALSKRNNVKDSSQPFGVSRDGFVLAEGAAAIVLERLDVAAERKAPVLAELLNVESVSNAFHMTNMRTNGTDLIRLIERLLSHSDVGAEQVSMVDVHGTSTKVNDLSEATALRQLFFDRNLKPHITAQKSITGHSLGASNVIELVGLTCMLHGQFIPGLPTASVIEESLGIPITDQTLADVNLDYAVKLSSSFSGMHSAALLRRFHGT